MLPILNSIVGQVMSTSNKLPSRSRRKKLDVPVHQTHDTSDEPIRKTFAANFTSKKHRHHVNEEFQKVTTESAHQQETLNHKLSRRHLSKENQRLIRENEEIVSKFNELEELSVNKITKLKEQISSLENANESVVGDNKMLEEQCQDLAAKIEELSYRLELAKQCKSCEELKNNVETIDDNYKQLQKNKSELEEDLYMLKNVVYRLNVQLERYQEKLREAHLTVLPSQANIQRGQNSEGDLHFLGETHSDHTHTPVSWGKVNIHTLGPLLDGYQDTITEKDEIIRSYETELFNFTGKLKEIVRENELLHQRLTEDEDSSVMLKEEVGRLKKELKVVRDQNDLLIKKCAMDKDKLDEVVKCYESKVDQLKRDYSVLHEQYCKGRTEVAALREKSKALESYQDSFKTDMENYIPLAVHTSSVNECKRWYEELKHQYEQEKNKQAKIIEKFEDQVSTLLKEKENLENKVKQLDKVIKKGESKFLELEHTLNEVQLSRSACRKQLHKAMSFAKELVAEQETLLLALNQRQQENKAVKKIGSDIATRMDSLKNQLKDVQRDAWRELRTVEKKMQEQRDTIEGMKQEHDEEINRLQKIIKEQEDGNLLLKKQQEIPLPHYLLFRDKYK